MENRILFDGITPKQTTADTEVLSPGLLPSGYLHNPGTPPFPGLPRLTRAARGVLCLPEIQQNQASTFREAPCPRGVTRQPAPSQRQQPRCPSTGPVQETSCKRFHLQPARFTGRRSSHRSAAKHRRCFKGSEWARVSGRRERLSPRVTSSAHHGAGSDSGPGETQERSGGR